MYLLVLYFPFISFLSLGLFGNFIGKKGANILSTFLIFLNMILSYFIFYEVVLKNSICFIKLFNWIDLGLFNVVWGFLFDPLTGSMLILINTVSFLVHFYSIEYMRYDPFSIRFMSYLSLFTFFMVVLVTSDNFLQLFLGWEGVGLVSYLLINFWFTIQEANKAALKAILMNRIGDVGLILGIACIYYKFKTLDFCILFPLIHLSSNDLFFLFNGYVNVLNVISFFVLIGAIGKSAQFGLHTWLPDAMAGPTPVSALIHAATMVTAGVFVLIRISPILEYSKWSLNIIALIGVLTAFFSASIGLFQYDIKKIIAYSTCSQLGYMVFICGLSNYSLSLFHLVNHGFFKALLFLSAGSIIHAMSDEQDIRKYGGLIQILPLSYIMLLIGSLSLMGIPFLTGFYSKDVIIEISYSSYTINSTFINWLSILSAFFTSVYSIRLIFFTFITKPNGFKQNYKYSSESSLYITIPLMVLSVASIFFGYVFKDLYIGMGVDTWLNMISNTNTKKIVILDSEFMAPHRKNIPVFFSLLGIFFVCCFNYFFSYISESFRKDSVFMFYFVLAYNFFINKWYIDVLYNKILIKSFYNISFFYLKNIDRGFIELIGPLGIVRFFNFLVLKLNFFQTGYIFNYLFIFILTLFLMLYVYVLSIFFFNVEVFFLYLFIIMFSKKKYNY